MKHVLFLTLFVVFYAPIFAQTVQGGGGICHTNGDPNDVTALETQDVRSGCFFAVDTTNSTRLWYYKHDATAGARWQLIDLSLTDSDTRLNNPRVSNDTLLFDLYNVKTSTVIGTQFVLVTSIAPVQSVAGSTGVSVTPSSGTYTVAPANDLGAVEALTTTGVVVRTGVETWFTRAITGTARIAVTNGDGVSGNPTLDIAQQSATTGQVLKWNGTSWAPANDNNTGGTVTSVGLTAPAAGITVGNSPITGAGNMSLTLANDLGAVEGLTGTGVAVRTASDTWTTREVTAGSGISVTNGTGVSGNIQITATDVSATNELQTLSLSNDTLSISSGNSIVLPTADNIYTADGTLTGDRTVTQSGYQLNFDGAKNSSYLVGIVNSGISGIGLQVTGVTGVKGISTSGYGLHGVSSSGQPLYLERLNSSAGLQYATFLYHNRTSAAANDGTGDWIWANNGSGTPVNFANRQIIFTDVTAGAHSAEFRWQLANAGTVATRMTLKSTGQLQLNQYGGSGFTGTATKFLAVNSAGDIIQEDIPTGTTNLTFTGSASPYTLNSSSGTDVTFAEGAGISITRSSNELTIAFKEVSAKSQADAATQGVAIGGYFYAAIDNTMGAVPGTKIRRMY